MKRNVRIAFVVLTVLALLILVLFLYRFLMPSSSRDIERFVRSTDQKPVSCVKPPPEDIPKDINVKLDVAVESIVGIAKGSAGFQFDAEKIVRDLPANLHTFEIVEFRICVAYVNGILTENEYKTSLDKIIPELRTTKNRLSEMSQVPTQGERIGIWVARIRGDSEQYSAQRELVQKLELYLQRETALKTLVEVRELGEEVIGITETERETFARTLCLKVNAAMIIWGEIAGLLNKDEFFPRITIGKNLKKVDSPLRLEPVNDMLRNQEFQAPQPYIIRVAPQRVREPIRLAQYIVAIRYYENKHWSKAAESFEALLQEGIPENIHDRDIHVFAGFSNYYLSSSKTPKEFLLKAKSHFLTARQSYETSKKDSGYPYVLNVLGTTYMFLYMAGIEGNSSIDDAEKFFIEASKLWLKEGDTEGYWSAQGNLGATYNVLAIRGINKQQNIERGINIIEKQLDAVTQ